MIEQALLVLEGVSEVKSMPVNAAAVKRGRMDSSGNGALTGFMAVFWWLTALSSPSRDLMPADVRADG